MSNVKIYSNQCRVQHVGSTFKHLVLSLKGEQLIADVLQTPDAWKHIQSDQTHRLKKGDTVTIVAADGNSLADQAMVIKAEKGEVWFSKPLRLIRFEEVGLFGDGRLEVTPVGTGYSVRNIREGHTEGKIFHSVDAAKVEILKRQPVKAA